MVYTYKWFTVGLYVVYSRFIGGFGNAQNIRSLCIASNVITLMHCPLNNENIFSINFNFKINIWGQTGKRSNITEFFVFKTSLGHKIIRINRFVKC